MNNNGPLIHLTTGKSTDHAVHVNGGDYLNFVSCPKSGYFDKSSGSFKEGTEVNLCNISNFKDLTKGSFTVTSLSNQEKKRRCGDDFLHLYLTTQYEIIVQKLKTEYQVLESLLKDTKNSDYKKSVKTLNDIVT
eukprot:UN14952